VDVNSGLVTLAPWMYGAHVGTAAFVAKAAMYNSQIQTVVFQVNAHDISVKLSLAKTALDVVNFVMGAVQGPPPAVDPNAAAIPPAPPLPTTPLTGLPTTTTGVPITTTVGATTPLSGQPQFGLASSAQLGVETMSGANAAGRGLNVPGASVLSGGTAAGAAS